MNLPKRLRPDPIIDSTVEIRFNPLIDKNAVYGVIYAKLRETFSQVEQLPVTQLPEAIRSSEPVFAYRPEYRMSNDNFSVQIGPNVVSVHSKGEYAGWTTFSNAILDVFTKINSLNIVKDVSRLGVRYISFFETNIFSQLKLQINVPGYAQIDFPSALRLELPKDNFVSILQLSNRASIKINDKERSGSVIDIDTSRTEGLSNFFLEMEGQVNEAHQREKELFYSLLTPAFLQTLNPEY